ncbi:hypothetical protein OG792_15690 [Micromonospora sp. NBC_01699]|uniref:hypothetical protein n=1 Tax=Micromonospora sp. NBC_01699 TaxID=2975984 RepID=UPI002E2F3747|nr:hypothetical protein [Micromonospora sp. NBC_01699]
MSRRTGKPSYTKAPTSRRPSVGTLVFAMLLPVLLAGFIGAGIGYAVGGPSETEVAVNKLREEEARRDTAQIASLTEAARATRDELAPLLSELDAAVKTGQPAPADKLTGWQQTMRGAVERHAESPSGSTATNVARGGLRAAVDGLSTALDTYALVGTLPATAQRSVLDLATRQRTAAGTAWSIAAAQLDQINIDAGHGHQHVYLTTEPGTGAFTSDGAPEGTTK